MYVLAVVGVAPGGDADEALEMPGEVAQIEESGLARDAAHGQPSEEQPLGVGDAYLDLVGVGRCPTSCWNSRARWNGLRAATCSNSSRDTFAAWLSSR